MLHDYTVHLRVHGNDRVLRVMAPDAATAREHARNAVTVLPSTSVMFLATVER